MTREDKHMYIGLLITAIILAIIFFHSWQKGIIAKKCMDKARLGASYITADYQACLRENGVRKTEVVE